MLGAAAALLVLFAVWRSTLGVTFADDGYYVSMALRLAHGGRVFADELFVQALGSLPTVPVAWLWERLFGIDYLAIVLRLFYVALAGGAAAALFGSLRRIVGVSGAASAAAVLVLAPPFNIVGLSYNSLGMLSLALAAAFSHRAIAEKRFGVAVAAAVCAVLAVAAYPPLVVPVAAMAVLVLALARDRCVALGVGVGLTAALAVLGIWFALTATPGDVRSTLEFAAVQRVVDTGLAERLSLLWTRSRESLITPSLAPMWLGAAAAALMPWRRARVAALALVPLLAALPSMRSLTAGADHTVFGVLGATYLITATAGLLAPVVTTMVRQRDGEAVRLLAVSATAGLLGYLVVGYSTQAGWHWGIPLVGLIPLTVALFGLWTRTIAEESRAAAMLSTVVTTLLLVALLTVTPFKSPRIPALTETVKSGAYAGLRVEPGRNAAIEQLQAAGDRWVTPNDRVFIVNGPGVYPLVGGRAYTPSVWYVPGGASPATIAYFDSREQWPDVALITPDPGTAPADDPLNARIVAEYRRMGSAAGFGVYRRD